MIGSPPQVIAIPVVPGADQRNLAELAGVEVLALQLLEVLRGSRLRPDLADALVDASGPDDSRTLRDRQRGWLLDIDVQAGVQRRNRRWRVPMIWRGDQHQIQLLALEHLAIVAVPLGLRRHLQGRVDLGAPDVAEGPHV